MCSSMGSSTGCSVGVCCPWSSSHGAGEALLQCLEHILPTFFSDLSVYRIFALVYSQSSLSQPSVWHFFSLLHIFLPRCSYLGCEFSCALHWVGWKCLKLAVSSTREPAPSTAFKNSPISSNMRDFYFFFSILLLN